MKFTVDFCHVPVNSFVSINILVILSLSLYVSVEIFKSPSLYLLSL